MSNPKISYYAFFGEVQTLGIIKKINNTLESSKTLGFNTEKKFFLNNSQGLMLCVVSLLSDNSNIIIIRFYDLFFPFLFFPLLYKRLTGIKIIIDVPTPRVVLLKEIKGVKNILSFNIRRIWNCLSFTWIFIPVNRIIQYADESFWFSFGVKAKTIKIGNGVLVDEEVPLTKSSWPATELNLIGVAHLAKWHGYDRLIKALVLVNKKNLPYRVNFTIVGDGAERAALEDLVNRNELNKQVSFTGTLSGKELDDAFANKHIGVSSLGLYRKGLAEASDLKTREYMVRGLSVIGAGSDPDFTNNSSYRVLVSNDERISTVVDIISSFENYMLPNPSEVREFAEKNLSFDFKIKKILDFDNLL